MIIEDDRSEPQPLQFKACLLPGHGRQPLSRVCKDSGCTQKGLVCYTCEKTLHSGHETVSLSEFLVQIEKEKEDSKPMNASESFKKEVEILQERVLEDVKFMSSKFASNMSRVGRIIDGGFNSTATKVMGRLETINASNSQKSFVYDPKLKTADLLNSLQAYFSAAQAPKANLEGEMSKQLEWFNQIASTVVNGLAQIDSTSQQLLNQVSRFFEADTSPPAAISKQEKLRKSKIREQQVPIPNIQPPQKAEAPKQTDSTRKSMVQSAQPNQPNQPSQHDQPSQLSQPNQPSQPSQPVQPTQTNQLALKPKQSKSSLYAKKGAEDTMQCERQLTAIPKSKVSLQSKKQSAEEAPAFVWSLEKKSSQVGLSTNNRIAKKTVNDMRRLSGVLCNQKPNKWAVRVHFEVGPVFLGVCVAKKVIANSFESSINWAKLGHGNYVVGSDGYVFSDVEMRLNHKQKNFMYRISTILHFSLDSNTLLIENRQNQTKFELTLQDCNEGYTPCAYLMSVQDQVELCSYNTTQ